MNKIELLENTTLLNEAVSMAAMDITKPETKKKLAKAINKITSKKKLKEGEYWVKNENEVKVRIKQGLLDKTKFFKINGYLVGAVGMGTTTPNRFSEFYIFIKNKNKPNKVKKIIISFSFLLRL